MIKFGAHAFVWIGEWNTRSGNKTIKAAAKAGVDFIEIPLLNPEAFDANSHRKTLKAEGIDATCSLALPKHLHLPFYPKKARKFLLRAIEQVDAVGSRYLCGCIAYSLGVLTGKPPTKEERQTVVEVLGELAGVAQGYGISLGLEAVNRYETYMFNTLEDTRATILKIGAPNLRLHADTYHMNIEEEGFYKPIVATGDVLEYVHMSESHRGMVGTGTVNWEEVFEALRDSKFSGYLVLESFAAINPALAAATCLWRAPKHSGAELAAGGMKVLREGAKKARLV
jgi:D-psicose/D-tagatose/L-ribulose 3-epimerase